MSKYKNCKAIGSIGILLFLVFLLYSCPADGGGSSGGPPAVVGIIKELDPTLLYKADMHEDAQSLFNRSDIDNPYLFVFRITTVAALESIRGEVIITERGAQVLRTQQAPADYFVVSHDLDIHLQETMQDMYMLDAEKVMGKEALAQASVNDLVSYPEDEAYVVGIGIGPNERINFDALANDLTITVRLSYQSEILKEHEIQVTKGNPYEIRTWRDLQHIHDDLGGSYTVHNDIIFPARGTYGYEDFIPLGIGLGDNDIGLRWFTGDFEGNNYKIEGLYINNNYKIDSLYINSTGLFGRVSNATIQNINIYHVGIIGTDMWVGGVVGDLQESVIDNVHVYSLDGAEIRNAHGVGGLVGKIENAGKSRISNSSTHTIVRSTGRDDLKGAGGLIGRIYNIEAKEIIITNSYATGNVYSEGHDVGGLIGSIESRNTTVVENVYATGDVYGKKSVGGLIGEVLWSGRRIVGYATGNVYADANAGGLIGSIDGGYTVIGYATGNVEGCTNVGGIAGSAKWHSSSPNLVTITGYSTGNIISCVNAINSFTGAGGLIGNIPEEKNKIQSVTGYVRGKIQLHKGNNHEDPPVGLFIGKYNNQNKDVFHGYVSSTSGLVDESDETISAGTGLHGESITISEVTDANYQEKFNKFTFGDDVGQWTWEGDGKWPVINIGELAPAADQPIQADDVTSLPRPQELQTDTTLQGIEQLEENVFKVYETYSWQHEKRRIENRVPHADFYPTGLYVKPNQTITVTVTSDYTRLTNLGLFIGTYSRYPDAPNPYKVMLQKGENTITNPHNRPRLIYIRFVADRDKLGKSATVTIAGATKTPYFIHGKTKNEEFKTMLRDYDYDSILIVSDRIMSVASKETALQVLDQDWERTAELLDQVVKVAEYISGLDGESYLDHPPTTRILTVESASNEGPMHVTNYRAVVPKWGAAEWLDNTKIVKSWGLWHEVGHMYETSQFFMRETTVNIYSLAIERSFNQESRLARDNRWDAIEKYLAQPQEEFSKISVFMKLGMLQQLWLGYGDTDEERDKFFITLSKKIRKEPKKYISPRDTSLIYLVLKASEIYGYNLNNFFKKWAIHRIWGPQGPQSINGNISYAFIAVDKLNLQQPPVDLTTLTD